MLDPAAAFERLLEEYTLLVSALSQHVAELEHATNAQAQNADLADMERLAAALRSLADAFELPDVAALASALEQASAAALGGVGAPPVALPGAHDAIVYLRWRLAEMRNDATGARAPTPALPAAQGVVEGLIRALLPQEGSRAGLASGVSALEDDLSELAPEELEIVRAFGKAELRARDEAADADALRAVSAHDEDSQGEPAGVGTPHPDLDVIPVEMKRLFVMETEADLQELSALIALFNREPSARERLQAMTHICHKIKGSAATVGFSEFSQVALYFERAVLTFQRNPATKHDVVTMALVHFLELFDLCVVAADELEAPDASVVHEARSLYEAVAHAADAPAAEGASSAPLAAGVGRNASARRTDHVRSAGVDTLRVDSTRLDELMIHLSALAMNRGSLVGAHGQVTQASHEMRQTLERLYEKTGHIADGYFLTATGRVRSVGPIGRRDNDAPASSLARQEDVRAAQTRAAWSEADKQRDAEVDAALRALTEVVADVETHSATLSMAMMRMGQLIEAQAIVIANLQRDATRMRLAPLADLTPRLDILVTWLTSTYGKQVRFSIDGEMTEIDRTLLRALAEPLAQLVRNAIMHGIESPEERVAAGKPEIGSVWIKAFYAGSEVVIEVGDDGSGVNTAGLMERAIKNHVITETEADALAPDALLRLMFRPGVSSVDRVGAQAGSGIGLDEVATIVHDLKGEIAVAGTSSYGTVFRIRAPITLMALPAMEVHAGGQVFTVPFSSVAATLDLTHVRESLSERTGAVEAVADGGRPLTVYHLTMPDEAPAIWGAAAHAVRPPAPGAELIAVSLAECLGFASDHDPAAAIIIERSGQYIGFLVDAFRAMSETIVRPLPAFLHRKFVRGLTVRADDGAIALLLNVGALADWALSGEAMAPPVLASPKARAKPVSRVLIVDDSVTIRRTLDQMLTRAGFATAMARDGREALELMAAEAPRVVILDVEMPRMGGYELLRILRGSPRYAQTRVAMLTSQAGASQEQQARALGADDYLVKPCPQDSLIAVVQRLLTDSERL